MFEKRNNKAEHLNHPDASNMVFEFLALADHLAKFLNNTCASLVRGHEAFAKNASHGPFEWTRGFKNTVSNFTFIIGAGAWDLQNAFGVFLLRSHQKGASTLVDTISKIRRSEVACPGLSKIVFLTPYPYPLLHQPQPKGSDGVSASSSAVKHGFRNTHSIASTTAFFLQKLLSPSPSPSSSSSSSSHIIRMAVVDVLSIIAPRLVLDVTTESLCDGHYFCRIKHDGYNRTGLHYMVHTPGGNAVANVVLHALSL